MDRRLLHTQLDEFVDVGLGDRGDAESAHPVGDFLRPGEGDLHGYLLIKKHPREQRERVLGQQLVGFGIVHQTQLRGHGSMFARGWAQLAEGW